MVLDLLEQRLPVRALVHREDERSTRLATLGAEIATGDPLDIDAVAEALDDVRRAYFVYPIRPGLIEATTTFAQAGAETGLRSGGQHCRRSPPAAPPTATPPGQHWLAERVLDWSPIGAVHLRLTFFAEWLPTNWQYTDGTGLLRLLRRGPPRPHRRHRPGPPDRRHPGEPGGARRP